MSDVGKLEATDERKEIVRHTIGRISVYIKSRKLEQGTLTEQATGGFNLACDFLADELLKLQEFHNKEFLKD